jgi:hypothetical protein
MERLACNIESENCDLIDGRVKIKDDKFFWVETGRGLYKAKKSVSCLIEPRVSDDVLLSSNHNGRVYILSVLERESDGPSDIIFDNSVSLKIRNGTLDCGAEKLNVTGHDIALTSAGLAIQSIKGRVSIHDFTFLGRALRGNVDAIKIVSKTISSITERLIQKARESHRWIEGLDQTSVGRLRYLAKESLFMKGKRSSLMAENKVKIDGEKIHLG